MKRLMICVGALVLASGPTACGDSDEPARDVATENDMNAMVADPNNPFAASEMKMSDAMAAAVGTNASDTWVKKMIEHHRGAVEMSQILLDQGVTGHVADMARQTIEKQNREIGVLQKLVATGNPDRASAQLFDPAEQQMRDAMMAAQGRDLSDTFIRKMLEHHKGAVAMSDIALANGASGAIRPEIEKTKAEQQKDIEHIEGMLSGTAAAAAEPEAPAAKAVQSTQKSSAPAKPAPGKQVTAKPKPAEPTAPATDCLPEHRAAGHC